jgi:hypothetical protein
LLQTQNDSSASLLRSLLRRLRDLNLTACQISLGQGRHVSVAGCLSLDEPVERGVRYRLRSRGGEGEEFVLSIAARESALHVDLSDAWGSSRQRTRCSSLARDDGARLVAPAFRARLCADPTSRQLEHFLRRIVRTTLAA